jgi:S1-C subfamily serine protease
MAENPIVAFSDHVAHLVERTADGVVAVHGGARSSLSGIHWRHGVIVTAEEALERNDDIHVTLPGGRRVEATLAGRDPTTDVALLRFQSEQAPVAATAGASLKAGQVVVAVGNHDGAPLAALGVVAVAGGAWHSLRGGTIDSLIRLDFALLPVAEGGALVDGEGRVVGMTVCGPRGRALGIPTATIDRVVDQLLAKGRVSRGYLGAGLQPVQVGNLPNDKQPSGSGRGVLVVSIDPQGPAVRAGMLVGDIVTAWNGAPIDRVRDVMRLLGPDSVGTIVDLNLIRGGVLTALKVLIGERPAA